ncbi:TIGR04282 family arsenosugar biosynthesis glycosyltransferase, partial [Accumulibacter sp.]|uniref:TIGR04282 family arsenosugar biosynthesis glycosyltransferase n=1 Tax=Accumulibacter sp. TaxID=2053492 RepID=UPI0028C4906A
MAMLPGRAERVAIAVFARAPLAGAAKTRLIPALGAAGAARLQRRLTLHALAVAQSASTGSVTLWAAPDGSHRFFRAVQRRCGVDLCGQSGNDLGARMAHAFSAQTGPLLLIGTDCPALQAAHLEAAAEALLDERQGGIDAVFIPADDGGYVLVGLRRPQQQLFEGIDWGTDRVMAQTRECLRLRGLRWVELPTLWDVDRPADLARLASLAGFAEALAAI